MILRYQLPANAITIIVIAVSFAPVLAAQPGNSLLGQLTQQYILTKVDPDGTITEVGTVVSLRHQFLRANPIYGDRYQPNSYKKGRLSQPTLMKPSRDNLRLADSLDYIGFSQRIYITKIALTDSDVIFSLQAPAASTRVLPSAIYRAALSFQFTKGFVNAGNLDQINNTIAEVFTVVERGEASGGGAQSAPPTSDETARPAPQSGQSGLDIVHVGQTVDEVNALLGQPDKVENGGGKVIYFYSGLKITFVDGKVSTVR